MARERRGEEGVRRENESAPWHECNRGCGRRKIHDQDAIATRDRSKDFQTRLNQQIRLSECFFGAVLSEARVGTPRRESAFGNMTMF